ncbi:carbohydrate-binding protein [Purpureocillium lavendulum]|uniref:Carbohydrate-binding protein n=1 Tax=Purpureocillium lavendulum TaxID=1247861 RepID=A0AB34G154_9HYPO|nr:carbohydrate-binding protein [Purpureocillium lavendulum]
MSSRPALTQGRSDVFDGRDDVIGVSECQPAIVSWGTNRTDIFIRGRENNVLYKCQVHGTGSRWYPNDGSFYDLGGTITSNISAVSRVENRIDLFGIGPDGTSWHQWWNGAAWLGWESFGGSFVGDMSAVSWGARRLDVFARGRDNAAYHRFWNGNKWSSWRCLGGIMATSPQAVSRQNASIDVFFVGVDNRLHHKNLEEYQWTPPGHAWEDLGGHEHETLKEMTVASAGPYRMDIFTRDATTAIFHKGWVSSRWSSWTSLGGRSLSQISAIPRAGGSVTIGVRGFDNQIYTKTRCRDTWTDWELVVGGLLTDGPVIHPRFGHGMDAVFFARGPHNFSEGLHTGLYTLY